jgi:tetratricopeptide (TPR) repeat protein
LVKEFSTYNNKVDIWALGCILFEMASGSKAFSSDMAVQQFSVSDAPSLAIQITSFDNSESYMRDIIAHTLQISSWKRPTARQLRMNLGFRMSRILGSVLKAKGDARGATSCYRNALYTTSHYFYLWEELRRAAGGFNLQAHIYDFACKLHPMPPLGATANDESQLETERKYLRTIEVVERAVLSPYTSDSPISSLGLPFLPLNGSETVADLSLPQRYASMTAKAKAQVHILTSQYTEAIKHFKQAIQKEPGDTVLLEALGNAYMARGAVHAYNATVGQKIINKHSASVWRRGFTQPSQSDFSMKDFEKAITLYTAAQSYGFNRDRHCFLENYLAHAHFARGQFTTAIAYFRTACEDALGSQKPSLWKDSANMRDELIRAELKVNSTESVAGSPPYNNVCTLASGSRGYFGIPLQEVVSREGSDYSGVPGIVSVCIRRIQEIGLTKSHIRFDMDVKFITKLRRNLDGIRLGFHINTRFWPLFGRSRKVALF